MRARRYEAIVMAASSGGIDALRAVLGALEARLRVPVLIVQHTASENGQGLCELFAAVSAIPVVEAEPRQPIVGGCAYLAPPGYHLLVEAGPRVALSVDEKVCHVRPSADVLFESAADVYGAGLIGIVLSGANSDGARGLQAIQRAGGQAWVQLPELAQSPMMPESAIEACPGASVLTPTEIAAFLSKLADPA